MGLFDEVAGGLLKNVFSGQDSQGGMLENIMGLLQSSGSGGIEGLVNTFNEKGLGEEISSWIGAGENLPISFDQVQQIAAKLWGFAGSGVGHSGGDLASACGQTEP